MSFEDRESRAASVCVCFPKPTKLDLAKHTISRRLQICCRFEPISPGLRPRVHATGSRRKSAWPSATPQILTPHESSVRFLYPTQNVTKTGAETHAPNPRERNKSKAASWPSQQLSRSRRIRRVPRPFPSTGSARQCVGWPRPCRCHPIACDGITVHAGRHADV